MLGFLNVIPLLVFPTLIYTMFAVGNGAGMTDALATKAFSIIMPSGMAWVFTWGGVLLLVSIVCLFIEVLKSTRPTASAMVDNGLSIALFIGCFLLFLLADGFATTEFFLIMMMALLDFIAGSVIMINTAQRTVQFDGQN
ncbi:MAG: hypothetical protein ACOYKM_05800 [Caulobacterales bacterium]|jgi:hypothetical protein